MLTALWIIVAILLFDLIIFVHEFGHFFTAKLSGIKVNEFALGMGPVIWSKPKGETKYTIRAFPIGGFCAMEGEDEDSDDKSAFSNKALWKRIIVVSAGAIMNVILGFLLMMIILLQQDMFASTTVSKFQEGATSIEYGLKEGDKIKSIDGYRIITDRDLSFAFATADDNLLDMVVERNGEKVVLKDVKFDTEELQDGNKIIKWDFYVEPIYKNFFTLISKTTKDIVSTVKMAWASLVGLVRGKFGFNDIAGPVGAVSAIGEAAKAGMQINFIHAINNIIMMIVVITVNVGVVNLLPVPAFDGGRLVFLFFEAITGRRVPAKYEGLVHTVGFVLIMILMLIITFSDVLKLTTGKGLGG